MAREKTVTQSMRVSVRVRPPPPNVEHLTRVAQNTIELHSPESYHAHKCRRERFTFDNVFDGQMSGVADPEDHVYRLVATPSILRTIEGYSTCIFAYGQTGSGKTYTMMGSVALPLGGGTPANASTPLKAAAAARANTRDWGMIPRALYALFNEVGLSEDSVDVGDVSRRGISHTTLTMSLVEIYNEEISCLLRPIAGNNTKSTTGTRGGRGAERRCQLRESPIDGPYIEGVTTYDVTSADEALGVYHRAVRQRHTAATSQNAHSSRSHLILTLTLSRRKYANAEAVGDVVVSSKGAIHFIDLAGSERVGRNAMKDGATRLNEGITINQSLLALGNVLEALAQRAMGEATALPPYRDSKLTFLLKEALGGNSLCHMVATVQSVPEAYYETLSTLSFADRVKHITNHATVIERVHDKHRIIAELSAELTILRREHAQRLEGPQKGPQNASRSGECADGDVMAGLGGEAFLLQVLPLPLTGGNRVVAFALPSDGERHMEIHPVVAAMVCDASNTPSSATGPIKLLGDGSLTYFKVGTIRSDGCGAHNILGRAPRTSGFSLTVDGETVCDSYPTPLGVGALVALRGPEVEYCFRYVSLGTPAYAIRMLRATSLERRMDVLGSTPRIRSAVKNDGRSNRGASVDSCESVGALLGLESHLRELVPPSRASQTVTLFDAIAARVARGPIATVDLDLLFIDGDQWVTFAPQPDLFAELEPTSASPIVAYTQPIRSCGASLVLRSTLLSDFTPCSLAQSLAILSHMKAVQSFMKECCASLPHLRQLAVEEPLPPIDMVSTLPPEDLVLPANRALSKSAHIRVHRSLEDADPQYTFSQSYEVIVKDEKHEWLRTRLVDWNLSSLCVRLDGTTLRALLEAYAAIQASTAEGAALTNEWHMSEAQRSLELAYLQQRLDAAEEANVQLEAERDDICRDLRSRLQAALEDLASLRRSYDIVQIAADQQSKSVALLQWTVECRDKLVGDLRADIEAAQEERKAMLELVASASSASVEREVELGELRHTIATLESAAAPHQDCRSEGIQATLEDPQVAFLKEKLQEAVKAHDQQRIKALDAHQEVTVVHEALLAEQDAHRRTQRRCDELQAALEEAQRRPSVDAAPNGVAKSAKAALRPRTTNIDAPLPDGVLQQRIAALKKDKAALAAELEAKTKSCHRYDAEITKLRVELRMLQATHS